jgi:hypothetical protein
MPQESEAVSDESMKHGYGFAMSVLFCNFAANLCLASCAITAQAKPKEKTIPYGMAH